MPITNVMIFFTIQKSTILFLASDKFLFQIQPVSNECMLSSFLWLMRRTYRGIGTFSPLQGTAEAVCLGTKGYGGLKNTLVPVVETNIMFHWFTGLCM